MFRTWLFVLTLFLHVPLSVQDQSSHDRYAVIVALPGTKKLSEHFEWSCRTFGNSEPLFDMLVFHENNQLLRNVSCPSNVYFHNLGEKGLSNLIVQTLMQNETSTKTNTGQELVQLIHNVLTHVPKYIEEIKPLFGSLFSKYLIKYTYWTYTSNHIIWGNLCNWISPTDVQQYDYYSLGRNWDSGRLYLRGEVIIMIFIF
jgi:hypothetical protein